jgi:uncharacterized membrane protein
MDEELLRPGSAIQRKLVVLIIVALVFLVLVPVRTDMACEYEYGADDVVGSCHDVLLSTVGLSIHPYVLLASPIVLLVGGVAYLVRRRHRTSTERSALAPFVARSTIVITSAMWSAALGAYLLTEYWI